MIRVAIFSKGKKDEESLRLSQRFKMDLVFEKKKPYEGFLFYEGDILNLECPFFKGRPLFVDFLKDFSFLEPRKNQNLSRAVGARKGLKVLDLTAGFGKDSLLLSLLGCEVWGVERSPLVYALLENGFERARKNKTFKDKTKTLKFIWDEACHFLEKKEFFPDVIFLDPMFLEGKRSSLPLKKVQVFQKVLDSPLKKEQEKLLKTSLLFAKKVVLKRGKKEPPLLFKASREVFGKSIRYDVYERNPYKG